MNSASTSSATGASTDSATGDLTGASNGDSTAAPNSIEPTKGTGWRKYWKVFTLGFQEEMEYRANYLFETIIGIVTFAVLFFLWRSIYQSNHGQPIAGMLFQEMLTYAILAKFWSWVIDPTSEIDNMLPEDIRHGGLNRFLTRPLNDRFYRFSLYLAHKLLHSGMRIGPVIILMFLLPKAFALTPSPGWWYLPAASVLALILEFSFSYLVTMIAFWWLEIWGVLFLKRLIVSFLAGGWLPLTLFPEKVLGFLLALPFQYTIFFPIQIVLGKLTPAQIQTGLMIQIFWIFVFTVLSQFVWNRGLKQYTAAGI
jgi:ABC-2 type transport system permease protein